LEPIPESEVDAIKPIPIDEVVATEVARVAQRVRGPANLQITGRRTASSGSQGSETSRGSTFKLEARGAAINFNRLADDHGLHVNISIDPSPSQRAYRGSNVPNYGMNKSKADQF
jgi:hypothetical protein